MDNIQKLREKVEKDPKSTVFVRLADELKKAGELDDAIEVLKTGIEHQPGYMSARVALGKIYMDKKMADEAKTEFMQVVEAAPDNLFARKKLAEIYREEGDIELALEHYNKYLSLNPQDEEARAICKELENTPIPEPKAPEEAPATESPSPLGATEEPSAAELSTTETDIDAEDVYLESSPYEEDETNGFLSSLSERETEAEVESPDEFSLSLQESGDKAVGHGVEFKGFDLENGGTPAPMGQDDIDSMIEEVAGVPEEPEPVGMEETQDHDETEGTGLEAVEIEDVLSEEVDQTGEPVGVVEISEDDADLGIELQGVPADEEDEAGMGIVEIDKEDGDVELEGFVEAESEALAEPVKEPPAAPQTQPTVEAAPVTGLDEQLAEADAMVEREEYGKALGVYRRLLDRGEASPEVRQRAEELRGLIKLLGREQEIVEARLMAFLESLQRKKHEFFGSS